MHSSTNDTAYLRIRDIVRTRGSKSTPIIPVSAATWWAWVRSGKAPAPIKLSPGVTVWRKSSVVDFAESLAEDAAV